MPHDSNGRIFTQNGQGIDVRADVAYVLGRSTGDVGQLCGDVRWDDNEQAWVDAHAINIYTKHKPVRWNSPAPLTSAQLGALRWGLSLNANPVLSKNYQDPYWKYAPPRGRSRSEWYRILDFDGYNHRAISPLQETNITLRDNGQIHIDLSTIYNFSQNVEIWPDELFDFPGRDYVGFVLWDATRKFGYFCITDVQLDDVAHQQIPSTSWHDFNKEIISALPFSDGDVVEFFWCTYPRTTETQGGELAFEQIAQGDVSILALMASDSTHGHTTFLIVKLNFDEDLSFINRNTVVAGRWVDTAHTQWEFYGFSTSLQCTYEWPRTGESYPASWRVYDAGNIMTKNESLNRSNARQYYNLSMNNGSKTYTFEQGEEHEITFRLYGKLTGSPTERLFATITYNIDTGTVTYR